MKFQPMTNDVCRATLAEIKDIRQELFYIERFFCPHKQVRPGVDGTFTALCKLDLNLSLAGHFISRDMYPERLSTETQLAPLPPDNREQLHDEHRQLGWRLYAVRMAIMRLYFDVIQPHFRIHPSRIGKCSPPASKSTASVGKWKRKYCAAIATIGVRHTVRRNVPNRDAVARSDSARAVHRCHVRVARTTHDE